jgi:hypothetical protein
VVLESPLLLLPLVPASFLLLLRSLLLQLLL